MRSSSAPRIITSAHPLIPPVRPLRTLGMDPARTGATVTLALRVAYGAALLAAPGRVTRSWLGPAGGEPPAAVAVRGLGAREVAVHGAALIATWRGLPLRPWLAISIAGDVADIAATRGGPAKPAPQRGACHGDRRRRVGRDQRGGRRRRLTADR